MSRITHRRSGIRRDSIDEESIALDLTSDEYSCSENEHTADDDAVSHSSEYTYETYTVTESVNTSSAASVISSGVNKVEEVGKGKGHSAEDIEEIEEAQSNIQCEDNLNEVPVAEQRHFLNDIDKLSSLTSSQKNNNAVPPRSTTLNESKKVKEGTDTVLDNISSLKRKQEAMALIPATEQTTIKSNRNEYVQLTAKNAAISTVAEQSKTEVDKNKGLEAKSNTFAAHYSKKCHSRLSKQLHKHDIEKGVSLPIAASKQGHSSINPRIHAASTSIHCRQSASSNDCGARNHYAFLSFSKSRIYKSNSSIPNGIFTARKSSRLFPVETLEFQRNNTHIATGIFTSQRSFSTRANGIFTARKLNNNNFKYTSIKDLLKGQPSSLTASRKDRVRQHVNSNIGNKQSNSESHKGNMNSWHKLKDEGCGKTAEITTFAAASQKQGSNHAVHSPAISDEINEQKKATASLATNSEHNSPPTSTKGKFKLGEK
ncbi:hypothetical protein BDF20DRAFT_896843 [Mycotypha africana]|uniref:uncharacterized protein n=1 Tax=Mycotypha africana TaxID=64632 RepID=UPI00230188D2|nr:uncharacterized protein BDF20DRAFT_896843 [Mycotypha africana]KAI8968516.1 hypothetical protein BDF20DRAFT_896843 [Mycotypha africana]